MKDRKKPVLIIFLLIFCFVFLIVQATQAAYESTISGRMKNTIAHWSIKVNNQEITDTTIQSIPLTYTVADLTNVRPGKVGPGATLNYPVTIDASGSDVAIKITFDVTDKAINSDKLLTLTGVTSNDLTIIRTGVSTYSAVIAKSALSTSKVVNLNFSWVDNGTPIEYTDDTTSDTFAEIDFNAIQYAGETIVPYS